MVYNKINIMLTDYVYLAFRRDPHLLNFFNFSADLLTVAFVAILYISFLGTALRRKKMNTALFFEITLGIFIALSFSSLLAKFIPSIRPISYYFPDKQLFNSFPSQHMMLLGLIAMLLFFDYPELGVVSSTMSALVGILQWLSLSHWPIDILMGWFIGALIGFAIAQLSKFLSSS